MPGKDQKIIIVGAGETAEIACEYFSYDSPYEVEAFTVEERFLGNEYLMDRPVVPFEVLESLYPPRLYGVHVAISSTQLNRLRVRLLSEVCEKGYSAVSYVSSRAFVWRDVEIGNNCFIFENNVLQYSVKIGNNVVLWSGNHIGHRSTIGNNCFISSHVVISGFCTIGENCFIGVNSSVVPHVKIGKGCTIGAGAVVLQDTEDGKVYVGNPARALTKTRSSVVEREAD